MIKTCYFCKNKNVKETGTGTGLSICDVCDDEDLTEFIPNPDWLEYETLKKENEELKCLKEIIKSFAERCRVIFTQSDIPPAVRSEYIKHMQYEYDEIKRSIEMIEKKR